MKKLLKQIGFIIETRDMETMLVNGIASINTLN